MPELPERPQSACILCPTPREGHTWRLAEAGQRTCDRCLRNVRKVIAEIREFTGRLNPGPGTGASGGRGAPGFGSRPAGSPHVISMLDPRSKTSEVAWDTISYRWNPDTRHPLPDGVHGPEEPPGAYTKDYVWLAADRREHTEQERPPRPVRTVLSGLADWIAAEADVTPPTGGVADLCEWLSVWCEYAARHDWILDIDRDLRQLRAQLKPHAGEGQHNKILDCPNTIDEGDTARVCGAPLYEPDKDGVITCHRCRRSWDREHWQGDGPDYLKQTGDASLLRQRAEKVSHARRSG